MNINLMGSDLMESRPCYITVMAWVGLIHSICNSQNTSNIEMGLDIDIDLKFSLADYVVKGVLVRHCIMYNEFLSIDHYMIYMYKEFMSY